MNRLERKVNPVNDTEVLTNTDDTTETSSFGRRYKCIDYRWVLNYGIDLDRNA